VSIDVADTRVESLERIQPNQANNYENAHGGTVVRLMDELAAMAAMGVAGETCVTAHISSVDFHNPIPVGHAAELSAFVYDTGETSVEVFVEVRSRDPRSGEDRRTTSACFTLVAVNDDGDAVAVPEVTATTETGSRLVESVPC
jgi:acyl-CoA hydrolase